MSQGVLGQLKHLKTARARWPFPDEARESMNSMHSMDFNHGVGKTEMLSFISKHRNFTAGQEFLK